jgi:hypothetical protein
MKIDKRKTNVTINFQRRNAFPLETNFTLSLISLTLSDTVFVFVATLHEVLHCYATYGFYAIFRL